MPRLHAEYIPRLVARPCTASRPNRRPVLAICRPHTDETPSNTGQLLVARAAELPADLAALVPRLHAEYPGDVGIFSAFFLNRFTLAPGEAVFLGPNRRAPLAVLPKSGRAVGPRVFEQARGSFRVNELRGSFWLNGRESPFG